MTHFINDSVARPPKQIIDNIQSLVEINKGHFLKFLIDT